MGSSNQTVRGQGMELPPTDGGQHPKLVWFSFKTLNETFGIESQEEGCWIDVTPIGRGYNFGKLNSFYGKKHTEESRARMRESHKGRDESVRYKPCVIWGVEYPSQKAAAEALNKPKTTITRWAKGISLPVYGPARYPSKARDK